MSASSQSGWRILRQSVKGASRALFPLIFAASAAWAIVDTNHNEMSDLWEKKFNNGELLPETFDPQGDADGDGVLNIDEATTGTDPFSGIPPEGFLQPNIAHTPAVWDDLDEDEIPDLIVPEILTVSWSTILGKQYTLLYSPDLSSGSWQSVEAPFVANGGISEFIFTMPGTDKLFYRVAVNDIDEDGDGFSSYEEWLAGTDPYEADRDADGLPDWWEIANGFDPNDDGSMDPNNGPDGDPDGDHFDNLAEYLANTDPRVADSDADGLSDSWELENGFDPYNSDENNNGVPDGQDDNDGDGASNVEEQQDGSSPNNGNDFAPQVIEISKSVSGYSNISPYEPPSDPYSGYYRWSANWTGSGTSYHVVTDAAINPGYLTPILESVAFPATPPSPPADKPWLVNVHKLSKANIFSRSRVNSPPRAGGMDTGLESIRVWIKAPPSENEQRFHFVKAKDLSLYSWTTKLHTTEFISAEVIEMVVPANQSLSQPIDLIHVPAPVAGCDLTSFTRLVPVEVRDIKDHANTADDVIVANWDTAQNIADNNIAWIEAHASDEDAAPRMPQLELRISGLGQGITIEAKLEVQYTRGNGARAARNQPEDRVRIPANGNFVQVNGNAWNIYSEADWQTELTQRGFFGGEATLTYRLMNGQTQVLSPQTVRFRIGGKNPDAARARQYIESLTDCGPTGSLWFAYAIARSESRDYNGSGSRYNQFLRLPQNPRDNGFPLWGNDGGTRPGGYGMFQVTGTVQDSEVNIPRDEIWNWQTNATAARVIIVDKRRAATNWMTTQTNATHANGAAIPSHTTGNVTFDGATYTMTHACTIKAYNGASKPASDIDGATITGFVLDPSCPSIGHYGYWHSGQSKWGLCRFNNLGFNYVLRVCEEVQP